MINTGKIYACVIKYFISFSIGQAEFAINEFFNSY